MHKTIPPHPNADLVRQLALRILKDPAFALNSFLTSGRDPSCPAAMICDLAFPEANFLGNGATLTVDGQEHDTFALAGGLLGAPGGYAPIASHDGDNDSFLFTPATSRHPTGFDLGFPEQASRFYQLVADGDFEILSKAALAPKSALGAALVL